MMNGLLLSTRSFAPMYVCVCVCVQYILSNCGGQVLVVVNVSSWMNVEETQYSYLFNSV